VFDVSFEDGFKKVWGTRTFRPRYFCERSIPVSGKPYGRGCSRLLPPEPPARIGIAVGRQGWMKAAGAFFALPPELSTRHNMATI